MNVLRLVLWFGFVGLLPFWVSLVYVIVVMTTSTSDGRADAPWLVILSVPFCVVSLAIAAVAYTIYQATNGNSFRKLIYAASCFVLLYATLLGGAGSYRHLKKDKEDKEEAAGRKFIATNPVVLSAVPPGFEVSLRSSSSARLSFTYFVRSPREPEKSALAFVTATRHSGVLNFQLLCVLNQRAYHERQAGSDPCKAPEAIAAR